MRVVFFGTPDFAVPTLRRLHDMPEAQVVLVVTQPDRPAGRGRRAGRSPVGAAADALGLPVSQPATLRDAESRRPLREADADLFVVAAYGLVFGAKTLDLPRLGCVNVHASLLPRYRGASPVPAAILAGDAETGVTLMRMERGLDTGPAIAAVTTPIDPTDTTESLLGRLAMLGADLIATGLPRYASGDLLARPQPTEQASVTRTLTKADGTVDWRRPAAELERHVRAMWPWPRATTDVGGTPVQIHRATAAPIAAAAAPGTVVAVEPHLVVATGKDALRLDGLQPAGARPMGGADFARGRRLLPGARCGDETPPTPAAPLVLPA